MARPTLLTPELAHRLYDLIRHGAPLKAACKANGISYEVFRQWRSPCEIESDDHEHTARCLHIIETMKWDDGSLIGSGQFKEFVALIDEALGEHETRLALLFTQGAETDWHAAEAMLKRRYPEHWGTIQKVEVSGPEGGPIVVADVRERILAKIYETRERLAASQVIAIEDGVRVE